MDWRHRKYYLITYSMEKPYNWNEISKTVRLYPPYNHFNGFKTNKALTYDGCAWEATGQYVPSQMLSCRIADADEVELQMERLHQSRSFMYSELTQEICGQ